MSNDLSLRVHPFHLTALIKTASCFRRCDGNDSQVHAHSMMHSPLADLLWTERCRICFISTYNSLSLGLDAPEVVAIDGSTPFLSFGAKNLQH